MLSLHRTSFRQLLLVAFLLIAALLALASLQGLVTLERLIAQSLEGAERAVQATAAVQTLAERSVVMERAARQYLVLDDPALRERFNAASRQAAEVLAGLQSNQLAPPLAETWRAAAAAITACLDGPGTTARQREQGLDEAFGRLAAINDDIARQMQQVMQARNESLRAELNEWLGTHDNRMIFPAADGGPHRSVCDEEMRRILGRGRACGIPDLEFRMCRTTFASMFDGDEADRTSIMGHTSTEFTLARYRKPIQERRQESVEKLDRRLKVVPIKKRSA